MTKEYDLNKSFVQIAGPLMLGGLIAAYFSGISSLIVAGVACYFMLVAVNSIHRGETSKRKARR